MHTLSERRCPHTWPTAALRLGALHGTRIARAPTDGVAAAGAAIAGKIGDVGCGGLAPTAAHGPRPSADHTAACRGRGDTLSHVRSAHDKMSLAVWKWGHKI
jgi:hypothetical protein